MIRGLSACFGLAVLLGLLSPLSAQETRRGSADLLPPSTRAWASIPDWQVLTDHFLASGFGQLTQHESMKAFSDSLKAQVEGWLNDRNVRLGITVDDIRNLRSGEICFAGVLPGSDDPSGTVTRGSHGIVLLVDVAGAEDRAGELLGKVEKELSGRGAVAEPIDPVQGVPVHKFRLPLKIPGVTKYSLHAIADGWLVASDNEQIFREVVRRIRHPELAGQLGCLRDDPSFQAIQRDSAIPGVQPDLAWFIEPFGYVQLAQAIADEEQALAKRRNDVAAKLRAQGFDVFRAVGGTLGFSQLDHDFVHRTALHAPCDEQTRPEQRRAIELVNLENKWGLDFRPEAIGPAGANSYTTLALDFMAVRRNVAPVFDEFAENGSFDRLISGWNKDLGIDLDALISTLGNRVSVWSATARPIDEKSERIAIAIPCNGNPSNTLDAIRKLLGPNARPKEQNGLRYLLVENEEVDVGELDIDDPRFLDDHPPAAGESDDSIRQFNLFDRKFIAIAREHILITNHEDILFQLVLQTPAPGLGDAEDYLAVGRALEQLADPARICAREFGRIDQILEVNYEMLRQDKMVGSQTSLARIVNEIFKSRSSTDEARQRKIDGTGLPADYAGIVAPYLGPSGWVIEKTDRGWLMSGCVIKKKRTAEVIREAGASGPRQR